MSKRKNRHIPTSYLTKQRIEEFRNLKDNRKLMLLEDINTLSHWNYIDFAAPTIIQDNNSSSTKNHLEPNIQELNSTYLFAVIFFLLILSIIIFFLILLRNR